MALDQNLAALAAGAIPGQTATIGGVSFTVQPPSVPSAAGGSKDTDTNAKLPTKPLKAKIDQSKYPFVYKEQDATGATKTVHRNPEKPDQSYVIEMGHGADYSAKEISKQYKGLTTGLSHESRTYSAGGSSSHSDGHQDASTEGTANHNAKGDTAHQSGGKAMKGSQQEVGGAQEGGYQHSNGKVYLTAEGDKVEKITGNHHGFHDGDVVHTLTGNHYQVVTSGEYGVNVQKGAVDFSSGANTQIFAGKSVRIIAMDSIKLICGGSSIIIQPDGIFITSGGTVDIKSAQGQNIGLFGNKIGLIGDDDILISSATGTYIDGSGTTVGNQYTQGVSGPAPPTKFEGRS